MDVQCSFEEEINNNDRPNYVCKIDKQQIIDNIPLLFHGIHVKGKSNKDVDEVRFKGCDIHSVPQGLTKVFPNMVDLTIWYSNIKEIGKQDLSEYNKLERIYLTEGILEFLPGNLLEDFENLKEFGFRQNMIKTIEPNIFDGLDKLEYVNLKGNPVYNKCYSIYREHNPNATLDEIKDEIFEKFYSNPENAKKILTKFQEEIKTLKHANKALLEQNSQLKILEPQSDVSTNIKNLLQNENFKDFQIKIEERTFPVHKFLLAARSPTLAEILQNNPEVENLNLVDISVEIFEKILKFLYTDELPREDDTNILQVFAAAGRLKIDTLKNFAASKILDQINTENACEIFKLSNKYEHEELRKKSFDEIEKKYPKICFKDEWAGNMEKVNAVLDFVKKKEEVLKKLEDEFRDVMKK